MHVVSVNGLSYGGQPTSGKIFNQFIFMLKSTISVGLLAISIVIIIMGITIPGCTMLGLQSPLASILLLFAAFILLAANEGLQGELAGVEYIHRLIYPESDGGELGTLVPPTNRLKHLFVGQSFLVVTCSFLIASLTTFDGDMFIRDLRATHGDTSFLTALAYFVSSGLQGVFVTVILFQLLPSVYAKKHPVQVLSLPGVGLAVRLALAVESLGVLNCLYLVVRMMDLAIFRQAETSAGHRPLLAPHGDFDIEQTKQDAESSTNTAPAQHLVLATDTLKGICLRYELSAVELRRLNGFSGNQFQGLRVLNVGTVSSSVSSAPPPNPNPDTCGAERDTGTASALGMWIDPSRGEESGCVGETSCVAIVKYVLSTVLLMLCMMFCIYSLCAGYSSSHLPVVLQALCLLVALGVIFYCEGLKIAVITSASGPRRSESETSGETDEAQLVNDSSVSTIQYLLQQRPAGVESFMLGRQQIAVPLGFLIAQLTHFGNCQLSFVTGDSVLKFLLIGVDLPMILILLVFAQLAPQLLAEKHTDSFLALWGAYAVVSAALLVEGLGITQATFLIVDAIDLAAM